MFGEDPLYPSGGELDRFAWQGHGLKQVPNPRFIGSWTQLEKLRKEAMPLFPQLVVDPILLQSQVIVPAAIVPGVESPQARPGARCGSKAYQYATSRPARMHHDDRL